MGVRREREAVIFKPSSLLSPLLVFLNHIFLYLQGGIRGHWGHSVHGEVRGQSAEFLLSFHLVGLRARTQVVRLGSRYLYLLSHLMGPSIPEFLFSRGTQGSESG